MRYREFTNLVIFVGGFLAISQILELAAQTSVPPVPEQLDPYVSAVYDYVSGTCPFLQQTQRDDILQGQLVREIKDWPLQERLRRHRLFVFPLGSSFNRGASLVAVGDDFVPFPVDDVRDFNELLQKEGILIHGPQEARAVAELFLKCYRVNYVFNYGYDLGVNVVRSIEDIKFKSEIEKVEFGQKFQIEPPTILSKGEGYRFVFYSWEREGSGRFERNEVFINPKGIKDYRTIFLKGGVGMWHGAR